MMSYYTELREHRHTVCAMATPIHMCSFFILNAIQSLLLPVYFSFLIYLRYFVFCLNHIKIFARYRFSITVKTYQSEVYIFNISHIIYIYGIPYPLGRIVSFYLHASHIPWFCFFLAMNVRKFFNVNQ